MRSLLFLFLLFTSNTQLSFADENPRGSATRELTDKEADAIVLEEFRKVELAKTRKGEAMAENVALSRRNSIKNGKRTTFEKIRPPAAEPAPDSPASPTHQSGDRTGEAEEAAIPDEPIILSISATVYDREVTELRWSSDGERRLAYSNIDFSLFRNVNEFESGGKKYRLNLGLGEEARPDDEEERSRLPSAETFASRGTYKLESAPATENTDEAALLAGLEALHRYYRANERRLKIADQRRRALNAARQRYREANPPEVEATVIQFWREESSPKGAGE